jgi:hypothetical protein
MHKARHDYTEKSKIVNELRQLQPSVNYPQYDVSSGRRYARGAAHIYCPTVPVTGTVKSTDGVTAASI